MPKPMWRDEEVDALSAFAIFVGIGCGALTIHLYGWPTLGFVLIFFAGLSIYRWFRAFPLNRKPKLCSCNPNDFGGRHGLTCPLRSTPRSGG